MMCGSRQGCSTCCIPVLRSCQTIWMKLLTSAARMNAGRMVISVFNSKIIFFENDGAVAVHLRNICHVTHRSGSGNAGVEVGDGPHRWRMVDAEAEVVRVLRPVVAVAPHSNGSVGGWAFRTAHAIGEVDAELVDPP